MTKEEISEYIINQKIPNWTYLSIPIKNMVRFYTNNQESKSRDTYLIYIL